MTEYRRLWIILALNFGHKNVVWLLKELYLNVKCRHPRIKEVALKIPALQNVRVTLSTFQRVEFDRICSIPIKVESKWRFGAGSSKYNSRNEKSAACSISPFMDMPMTTILHHIWMLHAKNQHVTPCRKQKPTPE